MNNWKSMGMKKLTEPDYREDKKYVLPESGEWDDQLSELNTEQLIKIIDELSVNVTTKEMQALLDEVAGIQEEIPEEPEMPTMPEMGAGQ